MAERFDALLNRTAELALEFLHGLPERPVAPPVDPDALPSALGASLPREGEDPATVIEHLARAADTGLVASAGPRYSGVVFVRDAQAHRAAMAAGAAYLTRAPEGGRDGCDWVPESSRRARGFPVYAALRSLGRNGLAELVDRCCALARRMAEALRRAPGVVVLNEVPLNQVLVRFVPLNGPPEAADRFTRTVIGRVQRDGTCWAGATHWHGMDAMRISVCNWSTTEVDIDRSAEAILRCAREARGEGSGG